MKENQTLNRELFEPVMTHSKEALKRMHFKSSNHLNVL